MTRYLARLILLAAGLLLWNAPQPISAQSDTGAICISTFADLNGNGQPDANETILAGVNVNLTTAGTIIATHVTTEGEESYCFENLAVGVYTLTFTDSPTYRTTTANEGTYALEAGQRLTINPFGAVPVPPENLRAVVAASHTPAEEPLEQSVRLLMSLAASLIVMLFMIGVGAIILGMLNSKRRRRPVYADGER